MRSSRWHAQGNAYLLVERADLDPEEARRLVGDADGIVQILAASRDQIDVAIWNPDGSTAEISGNGTRIAAKWLADEGGAEQVTVRVRGGRVVVAELLPDGRVETAVGDVVVGERERLALEGEELELTPVSVGNPHAVLERPPNPDELRRLGPLVERHPRFPQRTNVQFARVDAPGEVSAVVWERGAGETLSSGTSAVAVAAATHGVENASVTVHFPGGDLDVRLERGRGFLTGPAVRVA